MSEGILPTSVRGLSNGFGFPGGGRTGPRGVELNLPAQPVADLSQFARYGAARLSALGDGWLAVSTEIAGTGIATYTTSVTLSDALNPTGNAEIRPDDTWWLYAATMSAQADTDLADAGRAFLIVTIPTQIELTTAISSPGYLLQYASTPTTWATLQGIYINTVEQPCAYPIGFPGGSALYFVAWQAAAAGNVTFRLQTLFRCLPRGVPAT